MSCRIGRYLPSSQHTRRRRNKNVQKSTLLPIPSTIQAKVCSVYAEHEKWVLILSVIMVYSPRQTSWQISGTPSWTQQGTWFLPSVQTEQKIQYFLQLIFLIPKAPYSPSSPTPPHPTSRIIKNLLIWSKEGLFSGRKFLAHTPPR